MWGGGSGGGGCLPNGPRSCVGGGPALRLSLGLPVPTHFSTFWAGELCLALGPGEEEEKAWPGGWAVQGRERQTKGPALDQAGPLSDDPQARSWGGLPGPTEGGEGDPWRPRHTEETQTEVGDSGRPREKNRKERWRQVWRLAVGGRNRETEGEGGTRGDMGR